MKLLAIETSCDDTGLTLLETKKVKNGKSLGASFKVLSNLVASQKIHAKYGGVFPMLAKKEHQKNLPLLLEQTLNVKRARSVLACNLQARTDLARADLAREGRILDAIAVTYGPGLEPSLWTGIVFAKELSEKLKIPIIPVNHMEGHIFSVFAKPKGKFEIKLPKNKFPMLSLLVSGGHTELVLIKEFGKYEIIGKTLDDAAGEAYDKVARMMGIPYPGGPGISKLAEEARKIKGNTFKDQLLGTLPRPMLNRKNYDFSFSGLKTATLYLIRKICNSDDDQKNIKKIDNDTKKIIAMEFENAVVETLIYKTAKAAEAYKVKTIIIAGGVSANKFLKKEIKKILGKKYNILFPDKKLTGDNSLMIGVAGYLQYLKKGKKSIASKDLKATGNLSLDPKSNL